MLELEGGFCRTLQELLLYGFKVSIACDDLVQLFLLLHYLLSLNLTNPRRLLVIYNLKSVCKFTVTDLFPLKYILDIIAHPVKFLSLEGRICLRLLVGGPLRQIIGANLGRALLNHILGQR